MATTPTINQNDVTKFTDAYLQNMANTNPEKADNIMNKLGYTGNTSSRTSVGGAILPDGTVTQNGTTPISTSVLEGAKTFSVPQVKSTEAQTNLGMKVAPGTPTVTTPEAPKTASQTAQEKMLSLLGEQGTEADYRAKVQQEAGLEQARLDKQSIAKEKADTTLKYDAKIAELKRNTEGMGGGQLAASVEQLESKKNQELANIAIREQVAQGNVQTALDIVKDKVDAKFEPIKNQINTLKEQFNMIQNDMSESEQMKAQAEITRQTKKLEDISTAARAVLDNAVINKAPQSVIDAIDRVMQNPNASVADVYSAAGSYGVDAKKRAEIDKINKENAAAGQPNITNPEAQKYAGALNVVLGSSKLTKENKADLINSINNGDDPAIVIKNKAKDIIGGTAATDLTNLENSKSAILLVDSAIKDYYKNGGDTGLLSGKYEDVINQLGSVSDPKKVDIAVKVMTALMTYRNATTGTAASKEEDKKIESIFPGITKTEGLNKAILKARIEGLDSQIDSSYSGALGSKAYSVLKTEEQATQKEKELEVEAENTLKNVYTQKPMMAMKMEQDIKNAEKSFGRPLTAAEFLQAFPEYK